ncbi:hypothetical protein [Photobacterium sp. DNB22_13_2]
MRLFQCLILLLCFSSADAYQVQPMLQEVDITGRGSYGDYLVTNDSNNEVTLEISIFKIAFNDKNEEILIPADDEFLILPPQTVIQSKANQTFRLRYLPNKNITESTAYRVVFEQLPVDIDENEQSLVEFTMRFSTIVIVNVPETSALAVISNLDIDGKPEVTIKNTGNGVLDLTDWKFDFTINGQNKLYSWLDMEETLNQRYLMPNSYLIINEFKMTGLDNELSNRVHLNSLLTK